MSTLATERTNTILMGAKLPAGQTSFKVPDIAGCFDQEQQLLTQSYKEAFGCTEAKSTFKIAEKDGGRSIYLPSVINKGGVISVEWCDLVVPLTDKARYSPMSNTVYVIVGKGEDSQEYSLKVRTIIIKPEDAKTKIQKEYATLSREARPEYLQKAWDKGTFVQLLSEGFPDVVKLADLPSGSYEIVDYRMNRFDKYEMKLADGRWCRTNTVLGDKFALYTEMQTAVSVEEPALMTLGVSTSKTSTGYAIYPTKLVSFRNVTLPVFDFGFDGSYGDSLADATTHDDIFDFGVAPVDLVAIPF